MQKVHLDTDLGGDLDDLCALALLLCWSPAIDLTGITVVGDTNGKRTGMVRLVLDLVGRNDIPVAAGADTSGGYYPYALDLPDEARYWPHPILPTPNPPADAIDLLKQNVDAGATLIAIGPYTNLYLLDRQYPGTLARADLYLMGGYVYPPRPGYPQWGNQDDFNVQVDVQSAYHVVRHARPTLTPLTVTAETALRHADLDALRHKGGVLGQLIARQAVEFAEDERIAAKYAASCKHVPEDIINFHHDPLACAVALGWRDGLEIATVPLTFGLQAGDGQDSWLTAHIDPAGQPLQVVTRVDGPRFNQFWLDTITGKAPPQQAR